MSNVRLETYTPNDHVRSGEDLTDSLAFDSVTRLSKIHLVR